jgi:hypothetical protein
MPTHVINEQTTDVQLPIFMRRITMTDAETKAAPTSYVELIPAPAANQLLVFHGAFINSSIAGGYTNIANAKFVIAWGDWDSEASAELDDTLFLNTGSWFGSIPPVCGAISTTPSFVKGATLGQVDSLKGKALKLIISNGSDGNLTAGDSANTIDIITFYSIIDL